MKNGCRGGLALLFFLPTNPSVGRSFPRARRYSPHSSAILHLLLYRKVKNLSRQKCNYLQLFCIHYHGDRKCQDKNAESILLCFKYYFRLSPPLSDYVGYVMTTFLTWLVGVIGIEPMTFCVLNRCSPI